MNFSRKPSNRNEIAVWLVIFVSAFFVTLTVLQFSLRQGRLLTDPQYNDSAYLADGALHLVAFHEGGIPAILDRYRLNPPHSPLSVMLAFFGYMVLGVHAWVPYAMNFFVLVGLFWVIADFLKIFGTAARIAGVLVIAASPIAFGAVHEFQPDVPTAVFILMGAAFWLRMAVNGPNFFNSLAAGMCTGLAAISKTPFFPYSIALGGVSFALFLAGRWFASGERLQWVSIFKVVIAALAGFVATALPHYATAWRNVLAYIEENLVGKKSVVWTQGGTLSDQFLFHVTGPSGGIFIAPFFLLIGFGVTAGLVSMVFWRNNRSQVTVFLFVMVFCTFAYIGIAVNHIRNVSFGQTFQIALIFTALAGVALAIQSLLQPERSAARRNGSAALWGAIALGAWIPYAPPSYFAFGGSDSAEIVSWQQDLPKRILEAIENHAAEADGEIVYFAYNSFIAKGNAHTVGFLAAQKNLRSRFDRHFEFYSLTNESKDELRDKFEKASFVILADPDAFGMNPPEIPLNLLGREIKNILKDMPGYELVQTIPSPSAGSFYIYRRIGCDAFSGFSRVRGLFQLEGPFPEAQLPAIRWVKSGGLELECTVPEAVEASLLFTLRNHATDQEVTIITNNKAAASFPVKSSTAFSSFEIPIFLSGGFNRIQIKLSRDDPSFPRERSGFASQLMLRIPKN
jgi:hypothetical protein